MEVNIRIKIGNRCYYDLVLLVQKFYPKELKIQLYMTPIRLVVLYCSETWILGTFEKKRLAEFDR